MRDAGLEETVRPFVQGVMEEMMALSQDGRGPADRGLAIDFPFIVTP